MTDDPLGPFSGQSVLFLGTTNGGELQVYRYRIDFIEEVTLSSIVLEGRAWLGTVVNLLDDQQNPLAIFRNLPGGNQFERHLLDVSGITGKTFFLTEINDATIWRYRSRITINFSGGFLDL